MADSDYDQWTEDCPKCHNRQCLTVYEVTLETTGEIRFLEATLYPDGFEIDGPQHDNMSTDNEKVRCDNCGEIFDLSDLMVSQ